MLPRTREKWGDQQNGTYCNPILNADYSDPDIVRINNKYYMITSTFHFHPGMAILESSDLVNWKTINYAIPNLNELDSEMNWDRMNCYDKGVYAGSLRFLEWKEKDSDGNYIEKSKWFMHTTLFEAGIVVSTADDIYGQWTCQYMKDKNGLLLKARGWDDNCPYWEFNGDGTLKAAYMIASNPGENWYLHIFHMSLDGMQLLDGDVRYMSLPFDTIRKRTGETPKSELFSEQDDIGDPKGDIIDKYTHKPILSANVCGKAHQAVMNEYGDILSTTNASQILGREGVIISDISSVEASKIITFGKDTVIGNTTFTGRHGENQKVSDYIYIFSSEYWDDIRIPLLRRAKCIYGDRFNADGRYIGEGTPENIGVYETQRICVNTYFPYETREPNQGGYIDVPPEMSIDGKEHWYWLTQHGNNFIAPECRPASLLEVTWIEGWPIVGEVDKSGDYFSKGTPCSDANDYDGTGLNNNTNNEIYHPQNRIKPGIMQFECKNPPIKGQHELTRYQDSDNFSSENLSHNWQWNYVPREGFWSLTERKDYLRLYAFSIVGKSEDFFKAGNTICQKYIATSSVMAEIKLDISNMKVGQEAGLAHFNGGVNCSTIGVKKDNAGIIRLSYNQKLSDIAIYSNQVILRSKVDAEAQNTYEYSIDDGKTYNVFGEAYDLCCGGYRGDCIGIYTYNNNENAEKNFVPNEKDNFGFMDVEYFKYDYSR